MQIRSRASWLWGQTRQEALAGAQAMQAPAQTPHLPKQHSHLPHQLQTHASQHHPALAPPKTSRAALCRPQCLRLPQWPTPHRYQPCRGPNRLAALARSRDPPQELQQQRPRHGRCLTRLSPLPALSPRHLPRPPPQVPRHQSWRRATVHWHWTAGTRWWMQCCGCRAPACGPLRAQPRMRCFLLSAAS